MKALGILFGAGLVLVVLGITLAIGSKVTNDFSVASLVSESSSIVNETVTADTAANETLAMTGSTINKAVSSCSVVQNNTASSYVYGAANYVCYADGTFEWLNETDTAPSEGINVSYSYTWETWPADYNTSHSSEISFGNLSSWSSVISTTIAAVVIIGLLLAGFSGYIMIGKGRV